MDLIINHISPVPVYEQIVRQVRDKISNGELTEEMMLPSVRELAKDAGVSMLTVKKAYDCLQKEGIIFTVHGKGSFVAYADQDQHIKDMKRELMHELEQMVQKARSCGVGENEIQELLKVCRRTGREK